MTPEQSRIRREFPLECRGRIVVAQTERSDGDFSPNSSSDLAQHRQQIAPVPWVWCEQVHGAQVAVVRQTGHFEPSSASQADALITAQANLALGITTADCAPIAVWTTEGAVAAIHAGWRGLAAGIVGQAVAELVSLQPTSASPTSARLSAFVGPHICAGCYEFSPADAAGLCAQWGEDILRADGAGRGGETGHNLDLRLVISRALTQAGVAQVEYLDSCSSCEAERWFSHRARSETQRNAMVVWWET